ncbi:unnamed protein product [Periconia digitata]|uniref:DUF7580 domain-containing protein n=1 Tax=Periconia digitata TaxID=1303443 RepID=A0A9W4U5B6_9PLEO|nr:unnamed protein product [Periconia digitata]
MEVAGVVLGAIPIILYALDNYSKAWDPLKGIVRWKETIETTRLQLILERQKLYITLASLGIQVAETTTLTEVERALQINQPSNWRDFMIIIRQMDDLLHRVAKDLYPDVKGPPSWEDAKSERANWEWRRVKRSFGTSRRKEVFKTLRYYNSALQDCKLEKREALLDTENRIVNQVRTRFDESKTLYTRKNARLVHKAISSSFDCKCNAPHEGCMQLQWHSNTPVDAEKFHMILSSRSQQQPEIMWQAVAINIEHAVLEHQKSSDIQVSIPDLSNSTTQTSNDNEPTPTVPLEPPKKKGVRFLGVHITRERSKRLSGRFRSRSTSSSKDSNHHITSTPTMSQSSLGTNSNTGSVDTSPSSRGTSPAPAIKLCSMLGKASTFQSTITLIPILDANTTEQLRIISMDHPPQSITAPARRPINLDALLTRQRDDITKQRLRLNRKRRFAVASALTWAVIHLGDSPWLDKILASDNIRFFLEQEESTSPAQLSDHPYLANIFPPSSLPADDESSNPTPENQSYGKQIQNLTLYTLAIRLIELGRDKSLAQLRQEYQSITGERAKTTPNLLDDFEVARFHIRELELDPGIAYSHATDRCLRFIFPGSADTNTFENRSFRDLFFSDVVAPVQATYELIPGSYTQV